MTSKRAALVLFVGCFGFFGTFAHGYLENTDVDITLQAARAWYLRGDPGLVCAADAERLLGPSEQPWAAEDFVATEFIAKRHSYGRTGVNGKQYIWFPIGHQALLVPCVALGSLFDSWFLAAEEHSIARRGPIWGEFYWARVFASFLSPFFAALSAVMLLWLARTLGASLPEALGITLIVTLCTQFWPGSSETMSNVPGAGLLAVVALAIARYDAGFWGHRGLLLAGAAGGGAVLVRYPLALCLLPLCCWALVAVKRRGRLSDGIWLVAGGLPFAIALLVANYLRFGSVTETGYSSGASFGEFPMWIGFQAILRAPGKGVLWFSLPIWFGLAAYVMPRNWTVKSAAVLVAFALPLLLYSAVPYWAAGQCWGIRYLTATLVLLLVVVLVQTKPWQTRARIPFIAVCVLSFVINLGGVLTPYIGYNAIATPAGNRIYGHPVNVDNNVNFDLKLTPITGHWKYAAAALSGSLEDATIGSLSETMFGVALTAEEEEREFPIAIENRSFNHWWWRYLAIDNPGFLPWLALLIWLAGTAIALFFGLRAFLYGADCVSIDLPDTEPVATDVTD